MPAVGVPAADIPAVGVDAVGSPARGLKAHKVGDVQEFSGEHEVAYSLRTDVLFDFGKADIRHGAAGQLRTVANSLKKKAPADAKIRVGGYTDSKGSGPYNQRLSERRARAVASWLAAQAGITRSRMTTHGYGEAHPAQPNTLPGGKDSPKGRQANRRVVIAVTTG